ncbi:MAG: NADPH-dependent reductase [Acidimicrobiales bacterium]|nr:NADPH-dependent reductase [Acidimicrobiales bacterium]
MSGSLQTRSTTGAVLASIAELLVPPDGPTGAAHAGPVTYERFTGIEGLPHFNPDRDVDPAPPEVAAWRSTLAGADAVVIVTPEYAHSYPGALKDALDWTVGSGEFVDMPVLLVSASGGGGVRAGDALAPVLRAMSARLVGPVSVRGVSPKVVDGRLTDTADLDALGTALVALVALASQATE